MKTIATTIFSLILFMGLSAQSNHIAYKTGEFLRYRVHYGIFNAAFASLRVSENMHKGKAHFHVVGEGKTSGALRLFYKVDDRFETFIDKKSQLPSKFIRKIDEGGHTRDQEFTFDHDASVVLMNDKKKKTNSSFDIPEGVQDMISGFYYLRGINTNKYKQNDFIDMKIFIDDEVFPFRLKILAKETVQTRFGKIKCIKIQPYVIKGRVFKAEESVVMWISDDKNHIPIRIKGELAVGSITADLHEYKNNLHSLNFF